MIFFNDATTSICSPSVHIYLDMSKYKFSKIMKREFKQWWSTTPPISTKWTIASHLNWTKKNDVGNTGTKMCQG